jgi:hypothetical protein
VKQRQYHVTLFWLSLGQNQTRQARRHSSSNRARFTIPRVARRSPRSKIDWRTIKLNPVKVLETTSITRKTSYVPNNAVPTVSSRADRHSCHQIHRANLPSVLKPIFKSSTHLQQARYLVPSDPVAGRKDPVDRCTRQRHYDIAQR